MAGQRRRHALRVYRGQRRSDFAKQARINLAERGAPRKKGSIETEIWKLALAGFKSLSADEQRALAVAGVYHLSKASTCVTCVPCVPCVTCVPCVPCVPWESCVPCVP